MDSGRHELTFQEAERRYAELQRERDAGTLGAEAFDERLKELMVQDTEGIWWAKSRTTGRWHYHDGGAWVRAMPPHETSRPSQESIVGSIHKPSMKELVRICAGHKGRSFYVGDAIPKKALETARTRFPIPADEGVAALVDTSTTLTHGTGLAVCEEGIRWRSVTPTNSIRHGFLTWRELVDHSVFLQTRRGGPSWHRISVGEGKTFVMEGEIKSADAVFRLLRDIQDSLATAATK